MDINVTIQATDLAEAVNNLADALASVNLTSEPAEATAKKRTRRSSKSHNLEEQASTEQATAQPVTPQPVQPVAPVPPQSVVPPVTLAPPVQAPQPGYWPQATADGKINQVQMPLFNTAPAPVPQPQYQQPPVYAAPGQTPPLQVATPGYTMDQLAVAGMQLVDAGRREEIVQLLAQFGVSALQDLPKERYAEYAMALRQMGARI
jgi:hypothetical protein